MEDFLQSLMSIEEELNTEDNSEESVSLIQSLVLKRKAKKLLIIDPSFILKRFDYTKEGGISFIKSGLSIDIKYEDIEGNEFSRTLGTKPATRALDALLMQLNYTNIFLTDYSGCSTMLYNKALILSVKSMKSF